MNEYEFRLVVQHDAPFELRDFVSARAARRQHVLYAAPHMRYRDRRLEIKTVLDTRIVYYKTFWFKWVHSLETPFEQWTSAQHVKFMEGVQTKSHFFEKETRQLVDVDDRARLYTFRHADGFYRLVFEWEYGSWPHPLDDVSLNDLLVHHVSRYWDIFKHFSRFSAPPYVLKENVVRKPVTYRKTHHCDPSTDCCLMAHKWDGVFGIVYSYADRVKEKWEDGVQRRRDGVTLGDGIVFAAEKTEQGVVLLDVYEVYGFPTASESRKRILTEFLPRLTLPDGFLVQQYRATRDALSTTPFRRDGVIRHDLYNDTIYKIKSTHSLDVVYLDGYFWLPAAEEGEWRRFQSHETLVNGHVYEVCIDTGRVLRERTDRLTGNTAKQIENILKDGREWRGPTMERVTASVARQRMTRGGKKKKKRM